MVASALSALHGNRDLEAAEMLRAVASQSPPNSRSAHSGQ